MFGLFPGALPFAHNAGSFDVVSGFYTIFFGFCNRNLADSGDYAVAAVNQFDVKFISFDDILKDKDILKDIDVIINVGDGDTAHTGGAVWENAVISTAIREFVYRGGGFIGVGEPARCSRPS